MRNQSTQSGASPRTASSVESEKTDVAPFAERRSLLELGEKCDEIFEKFRNCGDRKRKAELKASYNESAEEYNNRRGLKILLILK